MKTPRNLRDQAPSNISDLIAHLWQLYSAMTLDPALAPSADRIRDTALELEQIRKMAWEVYREENPDGAPRRVGKSRKRRNAEAEAATEWLRNLPAASPLKQ